MAPSTTATTFEPIASVDTSKQSPQPPAKENGNGTLPVAEEPTLSQKNYHDTLAYEDKWIGWDGPVWCKRYGRFENKEQAAEDDGYKPVTHQKTHEIHQCQQEGCACRVPFEHLSYVKDIQRRIEPMTTSLVALEHRVGQLVHHIAKSGEHAIHDALHNEDGKERFAMHSANGHQADGPMHAEHFEKHHEPMAETVAKLEGKVHNLTHQLHALVKQNEELIRNGQTRPAKEEYWQVPQSLIVSKYWTAQSPSSVDKAAPRDAYVKAMDFHAGESELSNDMFGFDPIQDHTQSLLLYPPQSSVDPSRHWDLSMSTNPNSDPYFPALANDSNWTCSQEQSWRDLCNVEPIPYSVPTNATFYPAQEYEDVSRPISASNHDTLPTAHTPLNIITEYEKWDNAVPGMVEDQTALKTPHRSRSRSRSSSSTPPPQPVCSIPSHRTPLAHSESDGSKPLGRSHPSSSSEGQSLPKRRQSWDGHSMLDLAAVPLQEDVDAIEAKPSSKIAHSVIERRYRNNLNAKITQLDQILISTREHESLSSDEKPIEIASRTRKADVLADAIKYVKQTMLESKANTQEILSLKSRLAALDKLVNCGDCALLSHACHQSERSADV